MSTNQSTPVKFLVGKRLYLRPISEADLERVTVWINDPDVRQYLAAYLPQSEQDEREWIQGLSKRKDTDLVFAIVLKENNEQIGNIGLHGINHRQGTAHTGTLIGRKDLWSKGYGSEAKMILLDYAFGTLNLRKINTSVFATNPRSLKCQEKCGYQREGVLKQQRRLNHEWVDEVLLAVFREDFLPLWEKFKEDL